MTPGRRNALIAGGVLGALGVLAGTFGAHGLDGRISPERLATFETGVRYHLFHAVALLALCACGPVWPGRLTKAAAVCFSVGIVLFAGSLYALAITGITLLGLITPFGGVLFIAGWVLVAAAAIRMRP